MTQKKRVAALLIGLLVVTGAVHAAEVSATVAEAAPAAANDKSARVTVLDKQTNRRETLVLVAGTAQTVNSLDIKLTKCLPDYAAQLGQDVAWLDISENESGGNASASWFSGWMFNTYPEVSTLDHPRYDVILQGCGTKARKIIQTAGAAPVVEAQEEVVDTETVADPVAPAGTDPYAVPGVKDESTPASPPAQPAAPAVEESAPVAAPAEPAAAAPVAPPVEATPAAEPAKPAEQQDLHQMMDNGTY